MFTSTGSITILLETDAPYLAPAPYRGELNSSKYIPIIAKKIAEILQKDEKIVKFCNRYKFIYKKNNQYHISTKGIKYFEKSKNNNYTYIYIQLTILVLSLLNFFF